MTRAANGAMIPIAFVDSHTSPVVKTEQATWERLSALLAGCSVGEKNGPGWMPADIDVGPRNGERVKSVSLLVLDVEAKCDKATGVKQVVGPEPPAPDAMVAELGLWNWRCIVHTTHSHTAEHPRYRLICAVSRALTPAEVKPLGQFVVALLGIDDCFDTGALEPARLFYLPRCPIERQDLFFHAETQGDALRVDDLLADGARINKAVKSAAATQRPIKLGSVIEAFNSAHDVGAILDQNDYRAQGRQRWLWAGSTTGTPGVRLLPDTAPERVYSSHGGDPLNDGHAHDAFDLFRILQHGGDIKAAVKDAARICGMATRTASPAGAGAPAIGEDQPDDNNAAPGDPADMGGVPPRPGFAFVQARDLLSEPKPIHWLIHGLFEQGDLAQLFGASGSYKSFMAIAWGCHIATGTAWQEKKVEQGAVFYIAGEGHGGLGRRLRAWELHNDVSLKDAPFFVSTAPASLMDANNAADVAKAVAALVTLHGTPKLIVIDTLARNLGAGDENSNSDLGQFVNNIDVRLRAHFGSAVLIVHHTGHVEQSRGRGGSSMRCAMDAEYSLTGDGDLRTLTCTKVKESELPAPMTFKLKQIILNGWADEDGELMTSAVLVSSDEKAKAKGTGPRLQGANRIAHDALMQALAEDGQLPGPDIVKEFGKLLAPTRVIPEAVWRQRAYDKGIADGEQSAKRQAFGRSRKALLDMYLVSTWNGFYWRGTGEPGHRDTGQVRDICHGPVPLEAGHTRHPPYGVSRCHAKDTGVEQEENHAETELSA